MIDSSPSVAGRTPAGWGSSQGLGENVGKDGHTPGYLDGFDNTPSDAIGEAEVQLDEDGMEVYGSADTRRTIVKDGILPARDARLLVQ
jgi:hypothetical protein